jgi:hypothetical protein
MTKGLYWIPDKKRYKMTGYLTKNATKCYKNTGYLERGQHWIRGERSALDTWLFDRTGYFAKEDITG